MLQTVAAIIGVLLQTAMPASEPQAISLSQWVPEKGDMFIVDTKVNMGYLVHPDGRGFLADVVGSGEQRVLSYGRFRNYNAQTPDDLWRVMSTTIQTDRVTFGPTGMFLRLYADDGETRTAYGIHDVSNSKELLANEDRYKSMGCILVRSDLLALLQEEYELHKDDGGFAVVTIYGMEKLPGSISTLAAVLGNEESGS